MTEPAAGDEVAEAAFAALSRELASRLTDAVAPWLRRRMIEVASAQGLEIDDVATAEAAETVRADVGDGLAQLLALDADAQPTTPLGVVRRAVPAGTEVLAGVGARPVERDDFHHRSFPDDLYGLTPASLADIDPALADLGTAWGAAKAMVHLRRRRA